MPHVGCDIKLTQTTRWCPKTRSAPIRTQLPTGTVNADFLIIILFYRISQYLSLRVMTSVEIKYKF